jgi:GntR family transcriptional repressor for pyruvate dehydrogenase complex
LRVFRPIVPLRAHEEVAEQIRRGITLRLVGETGVLPPERDLARQFGVGRATVQRAIALLQEEGLVERRRGRGGGTFVVGQVDANGDASRLIDALRRSRKDIEEVLPFRLAVEPAAAALAALSARPRELDAIDEAAAAAASAATDMEFMQHDTEFHLAVARAGNNQFFLESVERLRLVLNDVLAALPESDAWHSWSNDEHRRVARAVREHDAETARDAMAAHVLHADDAIRSLLASL